MEEVDNIILHSLRQIGCNIDEEVSSLSKLAPDNLVESVSRCLQLIQPTLVIPKKLPLGIAQRYGVSTALAQACVSVGFRGDIGYQTFLYSNVIEVRRVFMFLIERFPKETDTITFGGQPQDKKSILEKNIAQNIIIQLNAAWTPQYCKKSGIHKFGNFLTIHASNNGFVPQRLNIPYVTSTYASDELKEYWLKRSPTLFQQTRSDNICASLIHKNDIDCIQTIDISVKMPANIHDQQQGTHALGHHFNFVKLLQLRHSNQYSFSKNIHEINYEKKHNRNVNSIQQLTLNNVQIPNENDIIVMPEINEVDTLTFDIKKIKEAIEQHLFKRQQIQANTNECKNDRAHETDVMIKSKNEKKVKERTYLLLENPTVNLSKMKIVLDSTQQRISKLGVQWREHRLPLLEQLEKAKQSSIKQYSQSKLLLDQIKLTKDKAVELTEDFKAKAALHAQLIGEFEQSNNRISRNAYTSRILEIINNIKKQKIEISKILQDTRQLQKEINNINGQLDRQFTVTDDLLFKTAKKDEPSKKAYKLLATLHSDCTELVQLVQDTGNVQREVREIEDQIGTERIRNTSANLEQITKDLKVIDKEAIDLREQIVKQEPIVLQG